LRQLRIRAKFCNSQKGIDISAGGRANQNVGSVTIIDSSFTNTPVGVITAFDSSSLPNTAGSLILENIVLKNVAVAVQQTGGGTVLGGTSSSMTITGWGEGNRYTPTGPQRFQGLFTPQNRPTSLLDGKVYYSRSKPQYNGLPISSISSVRSAGARGDGLADDTTALQNIINSATAAGNVIFFDSGEFIFKYPLCLVVSNECWAVAGTALFSQYRDSGSQNINFKNRIRYLQDYEHTFHSSWCENCR